MKLDLKKIVHAPGASENFRYELDYSELEWNGEKPAAQPVLVTGQVKNMAGALLLNLSMSTVLDLTCDRCTEPFSQEMSAEFESLLSTELEDEDNDEIILLKDDALELDELLRDIFIMNMDTKHLCSEDCKGLCPGCGVNLNHEACRCKKEVDPRLAGLAKFLEKE